MQVSMPKITTAWCGHFKMVVKISWLQRKLWLQWTSWTRKMRLIPIIRSMEAHFWNLRDRGFEWKPPGFSILPLSNYMPLGCIGNVRRNSQDGLAKAHLTGWPVRWWELLLSFQILCFSLHTQLQDHEIWYPSSQYYRRNHGNDRS